MTREADHYNVDETSRILGVSPARVRQMLRAGEIEGERGADGGRAGSLEGARERRPLLPGARGAAGDETTVALPPETDLTRRRPPDERTAGTPSATSERLSESVSELRSKAQELLVDLDRLDGQLEAGGVEQLALREALKRERERADGLRAELEKTRGCTQARTPWRRLLGD